MKNNTRAARLGFLCMLWIAGAVTARAVTIDPQRGTADPDGKTVWFDGKLLALSGKGWEATESFFDRLPAKARDVVPKDVWMLSHDSSGMTLRFSTDASAIHVRWVLVKNDLGFPHMPSTGVSGLDLYEKDKAGKWLFKANGRPRTVTKNKVPFTVTPGAEEILYLPLFNGVKSLELGIPSTNRLSTPSAAETAGRKPIVFYGTSITQGGCASRPGMAASSILGRALNMPVINLGFSASGRMEPEMANLLAELDPSVYVLDCLGNMEPRMVRERVEPFVRTLRKAHPSTPILLVEDASVHNVNPTEKGIILRGLHEKLTKEGIPNLHFLSSLGMLGSDSEGTVDGLHPTDLGIMRHVAVFLPALTALVDSPPSP
jgi:hypothetical protein